MSFSPKLKDEVATLNVDGLTFDVIGTPAWSTEQTASYIEAAIKLSLKDWPFPENDRDPHELTLKLDDRRTFQGNELWSRNPEPLAEGDAMILAYEGYLVRRIA